MKAEYRVPVGDDEVEVEVRQTDEGVVFSLRAPGEVVFGGLDHCRRLRDALSSLLAFAEAG